MHIHVEDLNNLMRSMIPEMLDGDYVATVVQCCFCVLLFCYSFSVRYHL